MLRTPHRRLLAAVVTTALLLAPAAPALAAPAGATVSAVLVWLQGWLPWPGTGDAQRSTGADESLPVDRPGWTRRRSDAGAPEPNHHQR